MILLRIWRRRLRRWSSKAASAEPYRTKCYSIFMFHSTKSLVKERQEHKTIEREGQHYT